MKRPMIPAALGAALAAAFAATAVPAEAAVSSASIDAATATLNLDGADDNVTVSVAGGHDGVPERPDVGPIVVDGHPNVHRS